jgi:hypothetical protein
MFDVIEKILNIIKNLSIIAFFCVSIFFLFKISNTIDALEREVKQTNSIIRSEIPLIRGEVFKTTNTALLKIDNRLISIEKNLFSRIDVIESKTFNSIDKLHANLDKITEESILLSKDYRTIPVNISGIMTPLNARLDCKYNDSCWPNLFTDVLIDTRNTARTASSSFILFNREVPKITSDVNKVSTSFAVGLPVVIDNTSKITNNINRITKPRWYDRLIGAGVNGSMIWFNINSSR